MHPNPVFRKTETNRNLAFARDRGFGVLSINADPAPLISHVPFILNAEGTQADLHLVRSNPIARMGGGAAVLAVSGPDGYVSPDWYEVEDQVPTWNYVAVHLRGTLELRPAETLLPHLEQLSDQFEAQLAPKPIWKTEKVSKPALDKLLRMIVPARLTIEAVDGTWKLNQNKTDEARLNAATQIADSPVGADLAALSKLMKNAL